VLLSYALDARTEFTDVEEAHPAFAAEVRRILDELDQDDDPGCDGVSDRRHQLRVRWDDILHRVRALPGFKQFFGGPTAWHTAVRSAVRPGRRK
jgi:hypothetical protein